MYNNEYYDGPSWFQDEQRLQYETHQQQYYYGGANANQNPNPFNVDSRRSDYTGNTVYPAGSINGPAPIDSRRSTTNNIGLNMNITPNGNATTPLNPLPQTQNNVVAPNNGMNPDPFNGFNANQLYGGGSTPVMCTGTYGDPYGYDSNWDTSNIQTTKPIMPVINWDKSKEPYMNGYPQATNVSFPVKETSWLETAKMNFGNL